MACTPTRLGFELTSCNGIPSGLQSHANSTVLECAALCLLDTCLSIIFNDVTKECFLNPDKISPNTCPVFFPSDHVDAFNKFEVANDSRCPSTIGYSYDEQLDKCFKFHDSTLPYLQALADCKDEGGTGLLRVDSVDLDTYLHTAGYGGFIEGRDDGTSFTYEDGTDLTYTNWYSGHPVTGSNCIMKAGVTWSSVGCMTSQKYCCEYA